MDKTYIVRSPLKVKAVKWDPKVTPVFSGEKTQPEINQRDGRYYLVEIGDHLSALNEGDFIVKDFFGYEVINGNQFHLEFKELQDGNVSENI